MRIVDHEGAVVRSARATVNGVRLHYLTAGAGEPVLLLHGIKHECHDPDAITPDAIDEYVRCYSAPDGVRCMAEIYRATLTDGEQNRESARTRLLMPVLTVGSEFFIGDDNERVMREVADDVRAVTLPWGHQLAEESPAELAEHYLRFFAGESA